MYKQERERERERAPFLRVHVCMRVRESEREREREHRKCCFMQKDYLLQPKHSLDILLLQKKKNTFLGQWTGRSATGYFYKMISNSEHVARAQGIFREKISDL